MNMNQYGMYSNNTFGNIIKQSMNNMLNVSCGTAGTNYFTNCYGEINYDKLAGYETFNAVGGCILQMIASNKANKASEPQVNYTQELNAVAKEINTKEDERSTKSGELESLNSDKAKNDEQLKTLTTSLDSAEETLRKAETALKDAKSDDPKYDELNKAVTDATKKRDKIKKEKEALEKTIEKQEADIKAKTKEVDAIEQKIAELKDKQDNLQKAANDKAIDDAKSNKWQRSDIGCIKNWQNEAGKDTQMASKKDLERASYEFRKGAKTPAERYEAANAFVNMYESNEVEFKGKYSALYTAIKAWRDDPKNKID